MIAATVLYHTADAEFAHSLVDRFARLVLVNEASPISALSSFTPTTIIGVISADSYPVFALILDGAYYRHRLLIASYRPLDLPTLGVTPVRHGNRGPHVLGTGAWIRDNADERERVFVDLARRLRGVA